MFVPQLLAGHGCTNNVHAPLSYVTTGAFPAVPGYAVQSVTTVIPGLSQIRDIRVGAFVGPAVEIGTHMRNAHAYACSPVMLPAQINFVFAQLHAAIATWYGGHIATDELTVFVAVMTILSVSGVASSPTLSSEMMVSATLSYTVFAVQSALLSTVPAETEPTVSPALSAVHFAPPYAVPESDGKQSGSPSVAHRPVMTYPASHTLIDEWTTFESATQYESALSSRSA
jgi:hypothetical protein